MAQNVADSILKVAQRNKQESARWKKVSRELFWIISGQTVGAVGSIVAVRILTGRLSPNSYGELALGMTIVTIVQQIATGPLGQATLRFYAPALDSGDVGSFFTTVKRLQIVVSLAILIVGVPAAIGVIASGHRSHVMLILAALGISIVTGANGTVDSVQTAARHRSVVALHQAATQWARPVAAWLLIVYVGANSTSALAGYLIASILVFLSQFHQLRRYFPTAFSKATTGTQDLLGQFVTYGWPFSVWGVFAAIQLTSDRWVLSYALNNHSVGIYTAAYQLGFSPIILLATAASVFICPILFSRAGDGTDLARVRAALMLNWKFVGLTAVSSGVAALCTYLFGVQLVKLLCGSGYEEASRYLPGLVIAAGLFACGQIASHAFLIHRDTKALIAPKVVTGLLAFALYIMSARIAGVFGIVIANIVWTAVYFLWITRLSLTVSAKTYRSRVEAA